MGIYTQEDAERYQREMAGKPRRSADLPPSMTHQWLERKGGNGAAMMIADQGGIDVVEHLSPERDRLEAERAAWRSGLEAGKRETASQLLREYSRGFEEGFDDGRIGVIGAAFLILAGAGCGMFWHSLVRVVFGL